MLTDRDKHPEPGPPLAAPATPAPQAGAIGNPGTNGNPAAIGNPGTNGNPGTGTGTGTTPGAQSIPVSPVTTLAHAKASVPRWTFLPYAVVFAGTACGLAWTSLGPRHVMNGLLAVASALLVAAALRLVLPERRAGLLLSRRRLLDVLALASLGASIMVVVLVLPTPA